MKIKTVERNDLNSKYNLKDFTVSHSERSWGGKLPDLLPSGNKDKEIPMIKYNGCLHLIKKNNNFCDYYMAYRCGKPHAQMSKVADRPHDIINPTMWDVYFKSEWDGTALAQIRIYKDLSIKVLQDSLPVKAGAWKLDSRIVKRNGKFYLLHNIYSDRNFPGESKHLKKCDTDGDCCYMMKQEITLLKEGGFSCTGLKPEVLCPPQHFSVEKNWSIVNDHKLKDDFYHVAFHPEFTFLKKDAITGNCRYVKPAKSNFFDKLQKYYYPMLDKWFSISCTTPLIDFDENSYFGVGQLKILYRGKMPGKRPKLENFFKNLETRLGLTSKKIDRNDWIKYSLDVHHGYIYCNFLCTVSKKNFQFLKCSDAFTATDKQKCYTSTINFPMSITPFVGDDYIISLGLSDLDQAFLQISKKEIKQRLKHDNNSWPSSFGFFMEDATTSL